MTDPDGDGIYSITMMLDEGFSTTHLHERRLWRLVVQREPRRSSLR